MTLSPELLAILRCPESKAPLIYFAGGETGADPAAAFLFCPTSRLRYRIDDGVPCLLVEEAERLDAAASARLASAAEARAGEG
ncbi:MAG: hypothetical protein R3B06_07270 [Kofleriaceae bacterium]